MKTLLKILFVLIISFSFFNNIAYTANEDLKTWADNWVSSVVGKNNPLNQLENPNTDYTVDIGGQEWIYNALIRIARDLKNLFFIIAWVYFLILVLILLFSDKTEESANDFKKWIIWVSIWIVVTQVSYYFINILFDKDINTELAKNFIDIIVQPFINLLETAASFFFLAIMIYAFFAIVTSAWDEEKAKSWKMSVLYAAIWFIVVKISNALISATYWKVETWLFNWASQNTDLSWAANIIVKIIDWLNGFVWLVVILMIIYAWFMVLTSAWDEEKLKTAKSIILYIVIWLFILVANYLILTFFIFPEWGINIK